MLPGRLCDEMICDGYGSAMNCPSAFGIRGPSLELFPHVCRYETCAAASWNRRRIFEAPIEARGDAQRVNNMFQSIPAAQSVPYQTPRSTGQVRLRDEMQRNGYVRV
jgi:hypothetical protein